MRKQTPNALMTPWVTCLMFLSFMFFPACLQKGEKEKELLPSPLCWSLSPWRRGSLSGLLCGLMGFLLCVFDACFCFFDARLADCSGLRCCSFNQATDLAGDARAAIVEQDH